MSIEIIKVIKEAEAKAELVKKEAGHQAKQIITDANVKSINILEKARNDSDIKVLEVLKVAESEGQILYDEIINNAAKECKNILKNANENMDKATSKILERIVKASGDS